MIQTQIKTFSELTSEELYSILQLRSEVFVVEQDCVYQDIDGKDDKALHVLGIKNQKIIAYSRVFKPGDYFEYASIGRVVIAKNQRAFKYGYDLMKTSVEAVETYFKEKTIKISAQAHLKSFYNNCGFIEFGEEYLEDDIPHIAMIKK
ncbi:GNAT family N-acetyltransferase [Mariniflexile litorale]|uniref:GNAT family N-acetyltransferase n=1 Tax=Mariniflexile litorale TaxID=3045158 RepID=A0AAU7EJT1_9FLAO|nr:GNAT family N-acetyltransferase [Mariniflexile sp. KMM 9835]MDQ8211294.1 GNAT family N-acetyltransferase [Mariniflexile sp. KMM 9835]